MEIDMVQVKLNLIFLVLFDLDQVEVFDQYMNLLNTFQFLLSIENLKYEIHLLGFDKMMVRTKIKIFH